MDEGARRERAPATPPESKDTQDAMHALPLPDFIARCRTAARSADLHRTDTFADAVLRAASGSAYIVDVACGSIPHLGVRLRARGHRGRILFVDWYAVAVTQHEAAFLACLDAVGIRETGPVGWELATVYTLALDGGWLAIHLTPPRWHDSQGRIHKPSGGRDGADLLAGLAATGALGASVMLAPEGFDTIVDGASALGWPVEIERGVRSADFESPEIMPCVHVRFGRVG